MWKGTQFSIKHRMSNKLGAVDWISTNDALGVPWPLATTLGTDNTHVLSYVGTWSQSNSHFICWLAFFFKLTHFMPHVLWTLREYKIILMYTVSRSRAWRRGLHLTRPAWPQQAASTSSKTGKQESPASSSSQAQVPTPCWPHPGKWNGWRTISWDPDPAPELGLSKLKIPERELRLLERTGCGRMWPQIGWPMSPSLPGSLLTAKGKGCVIILFWSILAPHSFFDPNSNRLHVVETRKELLSKAGFFFKQMWYL